MVQPEERCSSMSIKIALILYCIIKTAPSCMWLKEQ